MNKSEASRYVEHVQGTIIGGDHCSGRLYYEGRPQGGMLYADSTEELREKAKTLKVDFLARHNTPAFQVYPADAWELRIFD